MSAGRPTSISSFLSLNALQADVLVELLIESLLSRDISTKDEAVIQAVALCEQCLQLLHVQTTTTEVSQINNDTSETEVEVTSSAIECTNLKNIMSDKKCLNSLLGHLSESSKRNLRFTSFTLHINMLDCPLDLQKLVPTYSRRKFGHQQQSTLELMELYSPMRIFKRLPSNNASSDSFFSVDASQQLRLLNLKTAEVDPSLCTTLTESQLHSLHIGRSWSVSGIRVMDSGEDARKCSKIMRTHGAFRALKHVEVWLDSDHVDRMDFFDEGISDQVKSIAIHIETPDVDSDEEYRDDGCSVQADEHDVTIDLNWIYKSSPNICKSLRCLKLINHMEGMNDDEQVFCGGGLEDLVFHLPQLEELFISRVGIDGDISCLGFLTNLSSLTLKYPNAAHYGDKLLGSIDSLASLTKLKHLQLYHDEFYGNLHSLNKLKRLEVLKLRGTEIEADGLHLPSLFPRLKILKLADNPKITGNFILFKTLKSVIFNNQNDITVDELSLMNLAKDCEIDLPL
jgi:hypothetical protein